MLLEFTHIIHFQGNYFDIPDLNYRKYLDGRFQRSDVVGLLSNLQRAQVVLNVLMLIYYVVRRVPYLYLLGIYKVELRERAKKEGERDALQRTENPLLWHLRNFPTLWKQLMIVNFCWSVFYHIAGIINYLNPLLTTIMILDLFRKYPILENIIKAVWRPKTQLFYCIVLLILLSYYTGIVAYFSFYADFTPLCGSLINCVLFVFDNTYKNPAGFLSSSFLVKQTYLDGWNNYRRVIFDFIYTFLVIIILGEIINGVIIDTFNQLRIEQEKSVDDKQNICFVCGQEKKRLNRHKGGYLRHLKLSHNMWNYIYYISGLLLKDKTDDSGTESYIRNCIDTFNLNWFPYLNYIEKSEEADEDAPDPAAENLADFHVLTAPGETDSEGEE